MKRIVFIAALLLPLFAESADAKPNVLLICVDDLRPELNCYGVDYIKSPHIDSLAAQGRSFTRHYVQAPTCGASRFTLLTGRYGTGGNGALFARGKKVKADPQSVSPSMPAYFRQNGYTTVSVGKVSHHPGGRGGKDWDDDAQPEMPASWDRHLLPAGKWQHPRGWMHGLANGEIRKNAKDMDVYQALEGPDEIYPDGVMMVEALKQLETLAGDKNKPFFLAVGILRPHLPFGAPAKYLKPYADLKLPTTPHPKKPSWKSTYHGSGEFMKYNRWKRNPNSDAEFALEVRRHYAACVTYADAQVGRLMALLKKTGVADDTIVVLWGDHGWHLGEHSVWGKHTLFEESLRSPLIVSYPELKKKGAASNAVVETLDIFPTLCDLTGLKVPDYAHGASLRPLLNDPAGESRVAVAYHGKGKTIRTDTHRLVLHSSGYAELYDHTKDGETKNLADAKPELVKELSAKLKARLGR
jgi:iduronate 2-sulfatase